MAAIQSFGQVENLTPSWYAWTRRDAVRMYSQLNYDYAALYRLQPNVRVCVDFLARNIAQLGLHQFERVSDTDRRRLTAFGMTRLLAQPLPAKYKVTRYRFFESMVADLGIYFSSFHLKIRDRENNLAALLRIPPIYVYPEGGLVIKNYRIEIGRFKETFDPEEVLHLRGYNPENPLEGLSPLETLRRVLAEEDSAGRYREEFWQNSARIEGFLERPSTAAEWSDEARERFIAEFNDLYSGEGTGGKTAVLEDDMKFTPAGYSARESEYLGGRKLTREECARAYHIPLPMVGILDHATLTNIREQHKQLYMDSLGPWLKMIEEDLDLQIKPEFANDPAIADIEKVYSEFNLMEKLQGDFEELVKSLQSAVGRPYMTANEGRARLNLPALAGDADALVTPLNVIVGGQASPRDADPNKFYLGGAQAKAFKVENRALYDRYRLKWIEILSAHYRRQESAIVSRVNPALEAGKGRKADLGGGVWWDAARWDQELGADLLKINLETARAWAELIFLQTAVELNQPDAFEMRLIPYLSNHARIQAEKINEATAGEIENALTDPDPLTAVKNVFKTALTVRALEQAITALTTASNFGTFEAAKASGLVSKTWRVTSSNPRESHAALDGSTVGIRENFANGLRWPGDSSGPAEELAGCQCIVEFNR